MNERLPLESGSKTNALRSAFAGTKFLLDYMYHNSSGTCKLKPAEKDYEEEELTVILVVSLQCYSYVH